MNWKLGFAFSTILLVMIAGIVGAQTGHAQQKHCTDAEARRALDEAVMLRTWDILYRSYKSYQHCDDGAIGEGYSESVARILVDHWRTLPQLDRFARKDAHFRHFVLRHLDATLNMDDVEKVRKTAKTQCPTGLRTLCDDLIKQANSAINEDASSQ
jgi:hypothetical protein